MHPCKQDVGLKDSDIHSDNEPDDSAEKGIIPSTCNHLLIIIACPLYVINRFV